MKQLTLTQCTFKANSAISGGSISLFNSNSKTNRIDRCVLEDCKAISSGGAIYIYFSDLYLVDSILRNNKALIGGAIRYIGIVP